MWRACKTPSRVQWHPKTALSRAQCVWFFVSPCRPHTRGPSKRETKKCPYTGTLSVAFARRFFGDNTERAPRTYQVMSQSITLLSEHMNKILFVFDPENTGKIVVVFSAKKRKYSEARQNGSTMLPVYQKWSRISQRLPCTMCNGTVHPYPGLRYRGNVEFLVIFEFYQKSKCVCSCSLRHG